MRKKYFTDAERKEAKKIAKDKWLDVEKNRKKESDRVSQWRKDNPDYNKNLKSSVYQVYTHVNSNGDLYIGCGQKYRATNFRASHRSKQWIDAFKDECKVTIVAEFKDRETARELEMLMIEEVGLSNLVNQRI